MKHSYLHLPVVWSPCHPWVCRRAVKREDAASRYLSHEAGNPVQQATPEQNSSQNSKNELKGLMQMLTSVVLAIQIYNSEMKTRTGSNYFKLDICCWKFVDLKMRQNNPDAFYLLKKKQVATFKM